MTQTPSETELKASRPADDGPGIEPAAEQAEAPSRRQKALAFSFAATGFLFVYVLSAGPMAGIHNATKFGPFQRALEIVYAPVVLFARSRIEPFAGWLKAYIEIFR